MKQLEVHLKSGTTFTVDATALTVRRNRITNEVAGIEWTTPEGATRQLFHVRVDEVAALVVIYGDDEYRLADDEFPATCTHDPVCDDEQECDRRSCDLCLDEQPCIEHRAQARAAAAADAAERSRG